MRENIHSYSIKNLLSGTHFFLNQVSFNICVFQIISKKFFIGK